MVIMPDNWPLGTRQVSFIGARCLDGGGERGEGDRAERQTYKPRDRSRKRGGRLEKKGENEDCLNDREKWM